MDREVKDELERMTKIVVTLNGELKSVSSRQDDLNSGLKKLDKEIEKISIIAHEMQNTEPGGGGGSLAAGVSDAQAELIIRKILLEDKELAETFKKIIENIVTFNQDKELMNGYIDQKNKKKKRSKIPYISVALGVAALVFGFAFYFFNPKTASVVLESGVVFYAAKKDVPQVPLAQSIEVSVTNESDDRYYFKFPNSKNEYYIIKKKK